MQASRESLVTKIRETGDTAKFGENRTFVMPGVDIASQGLGQDRAQPSDRRELAAIRSSVNRGVPWGDPRWTKRVINEFGLETTLRPRGRSKKQT